MNEQQNENNQRQSLADLEALSFDSLSRLSAKTHQAKPLARRIARAEAEGRARAGLRYLLHCLEDLALGRCDGGAMPKLQTRQGVWLHCDIANGFLPAAFDLALPEFLQIAEAEGTACLAFANGHSPGFLPQLAEDVARRGYVSLALSTDTACISTNPPLPPTLGDNPMALAVPDKRGQGVLIFEQGQAAISRDTVFDHIKSGTTLPPHIALDDHGRATQNPRAAIEGSILPVQDSYGFNIAVMVEILVLSLVGAGASAMIGDPDDPSSGPLRMGHCLFAIKPQSYGQVSALEQFTQALLADAPNRLQALSRRQKFETALTEGVAVPQALLERIIAA